MKNDSKKLYNYGSFFYMYKNVYVSCKMVNMFDNRKTYQLV